MTLTCLYFLPYFLVRFTRKAKGRLLKSACISHPYLSVFLAVFLGEVYEKGKGTLAEVGMHF